MKLITEIHYYSKKYKPMMLRMNIYQTNRYSEDQLFPYEWVVKEGGDIGLVSKQQTLFPYTADWYSIQLLFKMDC